MASSEKRPENGEWEAVFNAIGGAIWVLDPEFRIRRANKAAEALFHLSSNQMAGKHCWEIVRETARPNSQCPAMLACKTKNRESVEMQLGQRWFEVVADPILDRNGEPTGYVHTASEIPQRRAMESRLKQSNQIYRILSDFAFDWEYWVSPDGNLVYISPSTEHITGYTPAEFLRDPGLIERIVHSEDRDVFVKHFTRGMEKDPGDCRTLEFRILNRSGSVVWLEHKCRPVFAEDGTYLGQRASNRDISDRKQIELALRVREKQLSALLEASTETVFLMDRNGRVLAANQKTAQRLNTTMEALKEGSLYDFIPPDVAKNRKRIVQEIIRSGKPQRFEDERFGKTILNSVYPITDEAGSVTHLAVYGVDITEEKRARMLIEESRRKSAEASAMLQQVINTIPVRIFWKDSNGTYMGCNELFARDAGRQKPEDLIGLDDYGLAWSDYAELYRRDDQAVMAAGAAKINDEEPLTVQSGTRIWLRTTKVPLRDPEGRIVGLLGTYEDITQHKAMEERLRESEEKYRILFHGSKAPVLVIDPANGRILDANAAAVKYYGYDFALEPAKNITEINTLSADRIFAEMEKAKTEKRDCFHFFHRLANGEVRPVEVYSGPIRLNGRELLYSIVHDIGERKKMEEEKEKLINELRDALAKVRTLSGLLPICSSCKKIRNDKGYWTQIESYILEHSGAEFSHGICPECIKKLYPEYSQPESGTPEPFPK